MGRRGVLIAAWTVGGDLEPGALITGGLAVCLLAGTAVLATRWLLRPWYELRRREDFVRFVERQGAFGNMLIAAEEALRRPERWRADSDLGRALIDRLYRRATLQLTHLRPEDILPQMHRRKARWGLVATCGLWLLALVSASSDITQGLDRLRPPWSSDHVTVTGGMYAVVDATEITAGQDLVVEAVDFAGGQTAAVCQIKLGSGLWQTVTATLQPAPPRALGLPAPYRRWQAVIPDVRQDLAWRFRRDLIETAPQQVVVHPFPC